MTLRRLLLAAACLLASSLALGSTVLRRLP